MKLRETENAWKPTRLKQTFVTEEDAKTEALYKRVRSVLNKLTPQKFAPLVEQIKHLPIDTQERLQGVINLVFEKAVDEPSFSVEYALLCKELAVMEVACGEQESAVSFKKLIITRCQKEFEKNPIDDVARNRRIKEIDECTDPVSTVRYIWFCSHFQYFSVHVEYFVLILYCFTFIRKGRRNCSWPSRRRNVGYV